MSVERHQVQEENVGAYLLGALNEVEIRAFEAHLAECPVCRDEVERLRSAVDALPRSVTPVNPPARLKASLMEAVEADVRSRSRPPRRNPFAGLRERLAAAGRGIGGMRPTLAGVSVALVLVVGVLTGYAVTGLNRPSTEPEDRSRTLAAKVDKGRVPLASASLLVPGDEEKGAILRVHGMPTLGRDAVYQVWLKRDGETISQSLFNVGRDGDGAAAVSEGLTGADAVLVTRERAGGARAPSGEPVLSVAL